MVNKSPLQIQAYNYLKEMILSAGSGGAVFGDAHVGGDRDIQDAHAGGDPVLKPGRLYYGSTE